MKSFYVSSRFVAIYLYRALLALRAYSRMPEHILFECTNLRRAVRVEDDGRETREAQPARYIAVCRKIAASLRARLRKILLKILAVMNNARNHMMARFTVANRSSGSENVPRTRGADAIIYPVKGRWRLIISSYVALT